jgi:hypothetical protein
VRNEKMNIREIAQFTPNYFEINREERNYAAIFFATLCLSGNVEKFLHYIGIEISPGPDFGIYFEYAYLRDLWSKIDNEEVKKEIIRQNLSINGIKDILQLSLAGINQKFGVSGETSAQFLQYPGKWAIVKYNENFPDNDDFLKICRFKWSFNIKPDIVIHLDRNYAVCIEAKYESGEGFYPSLEAEKSIFNRRGLKYVGQTELQKYMMEDLLGVETEFMFLVSRKEKSGTHKVVSWAEAFGCLDMNGMPNFALQMVKKISG